MDDMAAKLTELLSDPQGMEKIKSVASSLFGGSTGGEQPPGEQPQADVSSLLQNIDPGMISGLLSTLGNGAGDERVNLLVALRPHLSPKRQERVDNAVKLLKLMPLMPLVKQLI